MPPLTVPSFCPLDCPCACSLEVHVEDGRVVRLEGDHRNPVTAGEGLEALSGLRRSLSSPALSPAAPALRPSG